MSISNEFIKLQSIVALVLLICITPILLVAAAVTCIYKWLVKPMESVMGEVALVTGGAYGLGREIAIELAKMGCHLAIVDIDLNGAKETVNQIQGMYKVRAKAYKVNVANYTELVELRSNINTDLGPVTILINNAGILLNKTSEPNEIQRMIDVNLTSHFWTKDIFLPIMKELRKGYIVSISSVSSLMPIPYHGCYSSTKFGVRGQMSSLRMELALGGHHNIHACTVLPWFLDTNNAVLDLTKKANIHYLYPVISGSAAARRIVEGMLAGEREITLPAILAIMHRVIYLLPISWQERITLLLASKQLQVLNMLQS
ncbi:GH18225 [Drosophila grimshawi]|uniref:GH18225 n=1 Tax=Drosophila grimshawi TaxID=7222 RepID=B4JSF2_DROGR|nr:GH18225 [Drosophila grimshawi]